jgi:hypothetical protein
MNIEHPETQHSSEAGEPKLDPRASYPELPDFVIIPRIPGLPSQVTGETLRAALQLRAETGVSIRRG